VRFVGLCALSGALGLFACAREAATDASLAEPAPAASASVAAAPPEPARPAAVPLPAYAPRITPGPTEPLTVQTARGPVSFQVELADTDEERAQGLMFRGSMPADRGMIFVFDQAQPQAFWMRNTYIPLDIIYIGSDGRIVSIIKNAEPLNVTPLPSGAAAQYVLEINGGTADRLGIAPGDRVVHRLLP